jgi:hypothetical protein
MVSRSISTRSRAARFRCGALFAAFVAFTSSSAHAQNANVAEALYRDGQQLLAAGKTREACLKFADSQKADPAIGTLVNLALCHEKDGKTASAWSEYSDAAAQAGRAGQHDREQFAHDHAAALEKQLHRLVLEMKTPVKGMEIKLDGANFGEGTLGTPIPLDPGEHVIEVTAPGKIKWSQTAKLSAVASVIDRIEVPALVDDPNANAPPPPPTSTAAAPPASADKVIEPPHGISTTRLVGFFVTGLGVAALATGIVLEVDAIKLDGQSADQHNAAPTVDGSGALKHQHAATAEKFAVISFAGAGAAIVTGTILIIVGRNPSTTQAKAHVVPTVGLGTIGLAGTF